MFFPKDSLVYQMTLLIEITQWVFNKYSVPMYVYRIEKDFQLYFLLH